MCKDEAAAEVGADVPWAYEENEALDAAVAGDETMKALKAAVKSNPLLCARGVVSWHDAMRCQHVNELCHFNRVCHEQMLHTYMACHTECWSKHDFEYY